VIIAAAADFDESITASSSSSDPSSSPSSDSSSSSSSDSSSSSLDVSSSSSSSSSFSSHAASAYSSVPPTLDDNGFIDYSKQLVVLLAGDSLVEPFWPQGTGCNKAFLAALDTTWFLKHYVLPHTPEEEKTMIEERLACFEAMKIASPESLLTPPRDQQTGGSSKPNTRGVPVDLCDLSPVTRYRGFLPRKLVTDDRREFEVPQTELFRFRSAIKPKWSLSSSTSSMTSTSS